MSSNSKSKKGLVFGLLIVAAVAGWWFFKQNNEAKESIAAVPTEAPAVLVQVERAAITPVFRKGLETSSNMEAIESVIIMPKISGKLLSVNVKTGARVSKGQVLATIDHRDQDAQIAAQRAQISASHADVEQAKVKLDDATREFERYKRLMDEGYATKQEFDTRETTYHSAKASYTRSQAAVTQAGANLRYQEVGRSEYVLKAPIAGTILDDYDMTPGTMLNPSTPVILMAQIDKVKAVINVSEAQATRVKPGMGAIITGDGFPGREVHGVVSSVNPYVDQSTRTVKVEVLVDNKADGYPIKPGMFAKVFIVEESVKDAITVHKDAISNGKVFVIKDGRAAASAVTTGLEVKDYVQITSGVEPGSLVVVSGGNALKDGDKVNMGNAEAAPKSADKAAE